VKDFDNTLFLRRRIAMRTVLFRLFLITGLLGLLAACSSMTPKYKLTIDEPLVSNIKYDTGQKKPVVLQIVDQRTNKVFHQSLAYLSAAQIDLTNAEKPIEWFSQALEKEFAARDIPVKIADKNSTATPDLVLTIKRYQITSRLVAWLTPWETYHTFMGELAAGGKTYSVRSYFFNGKTYGGALKEIEDACFNTPMSIMVKDVASKINRYALQYSVSDEKLKEIQGRAEKKIKALDEDAYRPVLELGNSNNPGAVKALLVFAATEDRFTRACALSGIGALGAQDQVGFLKKKYAEYSGIDKMMALKSIGDLDTPEAIDFIRRAKDDPLYKSEQAFKYAVDVYLER
jgi:hypothetical protein